MEPAAFAPHLRCVPICPASIQDSYSYVRSTASAVGYDSKQYYQQPTATAAVAAAQPQPSVAESYYQSGVCGHAVLAAGVLGVKASSAAPQLLKQPTVRG